MIQMPHPPPLPELPNNPTLAQLLDAHTRLLANLLAVRSARWGTLNTTDKQTRRTIFRKARYMASLLPADPTNDPLSYEASYFYGKEVYEEMCALYVKSWEGA